MKNEDITLNSAVQRPWKEAPWIVGMILFEDSLSVCCHISLQLCILCVRQFKEPVVNDSYTQFKTVLLTFRRLTSTIVDVPHR